MVLGREDFMPGTYYERDEDWLVTCPECHGNGTVGTGASRRKCLKCDGAGRIKRNNAHVL
jgi:DnaJ-class molecular chaperone